MAAQGIGEQRADGIVIHVAAAIVGAAGPADVALQRLAVGDGQQVVQGQVVLLVEAIQAAVVVAGAEVGRPLVRRASEVEPVAGFRPPQDDVAVAAVEHGHLFVIGRVAQVDAVEAAEVEVEVVHLG
ncbi:hypothetical protein D9M70_475790 [compost metagenome]